MKNWIISSLLLLTSSLSSCANLPLLSSSSPSSTSASDGKNIRTEGGVTAEDNFFDFFDDTRHHRIVIEVKASELRALDQAMNEQHVKYGHYKSSLYRKANFKYYQNGELKKTISEVGLRVHGNIFSRMPMDYRDGQINPVHFRISFDEAFSLTPGTAAYETRKKRDLYSLENLVLKWNRTSTGTRYGIDPYITESYAHELFEQAGIHSPKATLTSLELKVDNETLYLGVYTMFEPIDDNFLDKRFSETESQGNLYKALWQNAQPSLTTTDDWMFGIKNEEENFFPAYDIKTNKETNTGTDLKTFISTYQSLEGDALYTYLSETMDLNQWIRFQALDYLLGNPDNFRYDLNNYYIYFTSGQPSKMYWFPIDYDKALGVQDWNPDGSLMTQRLPYDTFTSQEWVQLSPLLTKTILSGDPRYTIPYENHLRELAEGIFTYDNWLAAYDRARPLYRGTSDDIGGMRWGPQPMGRPSAIQQWFCIQRYKALNPQTTSIEGQCPTA